MLILFVLIAIVVRGVSFLYVFEELTFLAALVSAVIATIGKDIPLADDLNRWDEAVAMTACSLGARILAAL